MLKTITSTDSKVVVSYTDIETKVINRETGELEVKAATFGFTKATIDFNKDIPKLASEHIAYSFNLFGNGENWKGDITIGHRRWDSIDKYGDVLIFDIDEGMTIEQTIEVLKGTDLSWHITTSSSHTEAKNKFRLFIKGSFRETRYTMPDLYGKETWKNAMWLFLIDLSLDIKGTVDTKAVEPVRQFKCNTTGKQLTWGSIGIQDVDLSYYLDEGKEVKKTNTRKGSANSSLIPSTKNSTSKKLGDTIVYFKDLKKEMTVNDAKEKLGKFGELVSYSVECPFDKHTHSSNPTQLYITGDTVGITCRACDCNVKVSKEETYNIHPEYTNIEEYTEPVNLDDLIVEMKRIYDGRDGVEYNDLLIQSWRNIGASFNKVIQDNIAGGYIHRQLLNSLSTGGGKTTIMEAYLSLLAGRYGALVIATKILAIDEHMVSLTKDNRDGFAYSYHSQWGNQGVEGSDYYNKEAAEIHNKIDSEISLLIEKAKTDKTISIPSKINYLQSAPVVFITQASFKSNQHETRADMLEQLMMYKGEERKLIIVDEAISYNEDITVSEDSLTLLVEALNIIEKEEWVSNEHLGFDLQDMDGAKNLLTKLQQLTKDAANYDYKGKRITATNPDFIPLYDEYDRPIALGVNQALLDEINIDYEDCREYINQLSSFIQVAINHKRLNKSRRFPTAESKAPWFLSDTIQDVVYQGTKDMKKYQASIRSNIQEAIRSIRDILDSESFYYKNFGKVSICSALRVAPRGMSIAYLDGTSDVDLSGVLLQQYKDLAGLDEDALFIEMPKGARTYANATVHFADVPTGRSSIYKVKKNKDKDDSEYMHSGDKMVLAMKSMIESLPEFSKDDKVLFIGYKDLKHYFLGENDKTTLDLGYTYDYTYWQGFYGENRWGDFNKIVLFGKPETPINLNYNKHMLMTGYQHAILEADKNSVEMKYFRMSEWAAAVIQGINRSGTRKPLGKEGGCMDVDIFITINGSHDVAYKKYLQTTLEEQMPDINLADDWDFDSWNNVDVDDTVDRTIHIKGRPIKKDWFSAIVGFVANELTVNGYKVGLRDVATYVGAIGRDLKPTTTWRRHVNQDDKIQKHLQKEYMIVIVRPKGKGQSPYFQKMNKAMMINYNKGEKK